MAASPVKPKHRNVTWAPKPAPEIPAAMGPVYELRSVALAEAEDSATPAPLLFFLLLEPTDVVAVLFSTSMWGL